MRIISVRRAAKGLSEKKVVYKHVFRNTLIPLVTAWRGFSPACSAGMMILEEVFALEGIGQKAYVAMGQGDIPFIMGYCMFLAILTVIGTLLSDIAYMLVDPRSSWKNKGGRDGRYEELVVNELPPETPQDQEEALSDRVRVISPGRMVLKRFFRSKHVGDRAYPDAVPVFVLLCGASVYRLGAE